MPLVKTLTGFVTLLLFCSALPAAAQYSASALPLDKLKVPPGFSIGVWAEVPNARGLTLGKNGTVFAGSSSEGNVYAITDTGAAREVKIVASGLNMPIGVAFKDGALYVSAVNRILRFDDIEAKLGRSLKPALVTDTYPNEKHHGGKYIAFGPDNLLYVAVGVPCNICEPADGFGLISRIRPDGTGYEVFARGVRNSVGFDWHPATKELWFTIMAATGWATIFRLTNSTTRPARICISAIPTATPTSRIQSMARSGIAASLRRPPSNSSRMLPR